MATITSKATINDIIRAGGSYPDDPLVAYIVEYDNAYGQTVWGVTWTTETIERQLRYLIETEYVRNPRVIFCHENFQDWKEI